ncbi:MAG: alcohol dehydrogenase catalytic domain-containing protein [Spirochaetaceae bacterium]|nr:alcohol dehydrogenase catalytic domain-containing protein [Spirochaetaceae bacterium]HPG24285.1 alcohol dehydrogenase catalytic domain-containing protein [Myxococcota bacterium]
MGHTAAMRAVVCSEHGIQTRDVPSAHGEGVRVRTRSASICQTDVNLARLGALPFTLGHEFAGVLDDGTPVGIEPLAPCGACDACARGDSLYCERGHAMVLGVGSPGGMAEEVLVPPRSIVPLPRGLDVGSACLIEPLAVNLHALSLARLASRDRVCIVGANLTGFGLLAGAGARFRGCEVDLEETAPHALEAAERIGLGTRPEGLYDVVVEADGSEASIAAAAARCAPGGRVLMVAGYYTPTKQIEVLPFVAKELTMIWGTYYGHHSAGRDVDSAAALLAQRPEIAEAVITHRFPLDAAREAFALVESDTPSLKVVLEP